MSSSRTDIKKLAGFAFSFGDALLELDKKGRITWGLGGLHDVFAENEQSINGKALFEFLSKADRSSLEEYLALLRDSKRPNPIELKVNGGTRKPVSVLLSGIYLKDVPEPYFLAFRKLHPEAVANEPGSWRKPDESEDFAQRVLALTRDHEKEDASLSVIQVEALDDFQSKLGQVQHQALEEAIFSVVQDAASEEGAVTRLSSGRYGVMHDASTDLESLKEGITESTRDFDESGQGLKVDAASLALSLLIEQPDSAEALAATLRQIKNHPSEAMKVFENAHALQDLINRSRDDYNMVKGRLDEKSFSLAFQPIVDLESRVVHHFEVLTRFDDSNASPFAFICAAENCGLIKDFDWVICEKVVAWKADTENDKANVGLAVNLSALSVQDEAFVADMGRLTASLGDLKSSVHFEITETGEIEDIERINTVIQALRERGHKVYLDDFGVGQTSLQQLRKWDIDAVKIDGSYVRDALSDASTRHILKAIAHLCNDLEIDCIAEMIEDEATIEYLLANGIRYGQGYLFGKPDTDISTFDAPTSPAEAPTSSVWYQNT